MAKKTPKTGDYVQRMVQVGDESTAETPPLRMVPAEIVSHVVQPGVQSKSSTRAK